MTATPHFIFTELQRLYDQVFYSVEFSSSSIIAMIAPVLSCLTRRPFMKNVGVAVTLGVMQPCLEFMITMMS